MPNLQKLLREHGTTYSNAFVHTPICCPSRSSILSGRYLHNGGALNNTISGNCNGPNWKKDAELRTFAVHAQKNGYLTSYAGKYLNQYGRGDAMHVPPGWDKWFGLVGNSIYYNYTIVQSDDGIHTETQTHGDSYQDDYLPDLLANRTLAILEEFLSNSNSDKPFLMVNAWPSCHAPFTPAPWANGTFSHHQAPRTPNWNASEESVAQKHWLVRQMGEIDTVGEERLDGIYRHRLETLLSVDEHIAQFVKALDKKGVLENTIIIFTSDNGFQLGQHRIEADKRQLYEHDIRVPFVVRAPSRFVDDKNVTSERIVMNIDIAPTIHHVVTGGSQPPPDDMDGISFLPSRGNSASRQDFLVSYHGEGSAPCNLLHCPPPSVYHGGDSYNNTFQCLRSISVDEDSMYCEFVDDEGFHEYYDLTTDEWQLHNQYKDLSEDRKWKYESRLTKLKRCAGATCRTD